MVSVHKRRSSAAPVHCEKRLRKLFGDDGYGGACLCGGFRLRERSLDRGAVLGVDLSGHHPPLANPALRHGRLGLHLFPDVKSMRAQAAYFHLRGAR